MAGEKTTAASRILLIQNDKASLYLWKKRQLLPAGFFGSNDQDLALFIAKLEEDTRSPITVVVDCIEEDFRHEVVAHVQGRDRSEMLQRKQSMLFRNTPYRIARVLGREATGRRDDKVLFSALSKTEVVSYWLTHVLAAKIPVRAITSAAYLMEHLAKNEGLHKHDHLLLVSVEGSAGIRQTYLQKGKLMFSRLLPMRPGQDSSMFSLIEEQSVQTRKYLERIKLMPYEKLIETIVYMDFTLIDMPPERFSDQIHFIYRDNFALKGQELVHVPDDQSVGCLLPTLAQCLKSSSIANTYGPAMDRRYYFLGQISKGLIAASIAIVLLTLFTSFPRLLEGVGNNEQIERLSLQTTPLLNDYEQLRHSFPVTPIPSNSMALIVETYDDLATVVIDPRRLMTSVGQALGVSSKVRLSSVEWTVNEQLASLDSTVSEGQRYIQSTIDDQLQINVIIEGNVLETFNIREAQEQVTGFMQALEKNTGGIVTPVSLPLDVSAVSSLELTLDDDPVAAGFVLELRIIPASQLKQHTDEGGM